jgi:hypothetical protein
MRHNGAEFRKTDRSGAAQGTARAGERNHLAGKVDCHAAAHGLQQILKQVPRVILTKALN